MPVTPHKNIEDSEQQHYVSSRKSRKTEEKPLQPPLTPMIDVTFQLLLYFLLTSTFRADEGQIPGSLPGGASSSPDVLRPIRVVVSPQGANNIEALYTVDNQRPTDKPEELYQYLNARGGSGNRDEIPVLIMSSGFVRWKYVVEAFNQSVRAKFKKIGFSPAQ